MATGYLKYCSMKQTCLCGSNHINIYAEPTIAHASSDSMAIPVPQLGACSSKSTVSVTLPSKLPIEPIRSGLRHAGLQFLRPPHRLPPPGERSRVSTENHARPTHLTEPDPDDAPPVRRSVGLSAHTNQADNMRVAVTRTKVLVSPARVEPGCPLHMCSVCVLCTHCTTSRTSLPFGGEGDGITGKTTVRSGCSRPPNSVVMLHDHQRSAKTVLRD